jgi:hypothetical protein
MIEERVFRGGFCEASEKQPNQSRRRQKGDIRISRGLTMIKSLFQTALFLVTLGASAQFAYSCSCFAISHEEEVARTRYIFVGTVVESTEDKSYIPPKIEGVSAAAQKTFATRKRYLVKFKLEERIKGVEGDEITIVKYEQENLMCAGLSFEKEKSYLIYAGKEKDKDKDKGKEEEISDNGSCSRTQSFDKEAKDYKELLTLETKNKSN